MADRRYSKAVVAALFKLSSGNCYWPRCTQPIVVIVDNEPSFNFQIAHIRGLNPGSARYDDGMTDEERNSFTNLILLCRPHHDHVDRINPNKYDADTLLSWKRNAESPEITETLSQHLGGNIDDVTLLGDMKTAMDEQVQEIKGAVDALQSSNAEASDAIRILVSNLDDYQLIGVHQADQLDTTHAAIKQMDNLSDDIMRVLVHVESELGGKLGELRTVTDELEELVRVVVAQNSDMEDHVRALVAQVNRLEELRGGWG